MNTVEQLELQSAAEQAAGNWQHFDSFAWFRKSELDEAEDWAIFYTHHRDSGILDRSNAACIGQSLMPFSESDDPDVVVESHSHRAVGWIAGFSIRVFRNGEITDAFKTYHALVEQMADYPILDESDYSNREYEATVENITQAAWRLKDKFTLPNEWEFDVYEWLSEHRGHAIENSDDQGGWPEKTDLEAAFLSLGYPTAS